MHSASHGFKSKERGLGDDSAEVTQEEPQVSVLRMGRNELPSRRA